MSSPAKRRHWTVNADFMTWLNIYRMATPGTDCVENTTQILGPKSEPQPDGCLFILPERGGQVNETKDGYLIGSPDLVTETSASTESIDLRAKKRDYEQAGVREYVVVVVRQPRVFWFVSRHGQFEELLPGDDGIIRSETFPGLWLDPAALLRRDGARIREVLQQGLASAEHAAFVARLAGQ